MSGPLVSTEWLAAHLGESDLVVADASWYLPASGRDARREYEAEHIPGAVFWDLDAMSDTQSPYPHMMPDHETFAAQLGALGVSERDRVVVYDGSGVNLSAPRAWWQLRAIGHDAVSVLDGGLGRWRGEGRALVQGAESREPTRYVPLGDVESFVTLEQVQRLMAEGSQVLDARSRDRFAGEAPEPREGVRSGHIPGSLNVPFTDLIDTDGMVLPPDVLAARFADAGVDLNRSVIAACGSGVTACALILGLEVLGRSDHLVYDGSWTEWGGRTDLPIASGS